ncbi:arsenate reductase family protein [Cetobacterium somerae]|uniref:arsenate reductase family protein n=1 Tax=Cetobacterium sp. NK01 TaxID=2993530 RepID=UPI0021166D70|nr:arsenate reductase family protein [Cetobacterium sp. NK01]MCQ8211563.1 arsenate reductase family protein [Cetobacterium sp. NK01]
MKYLFVNYPKCSTCIKARKWLEENGVEFESRHIVENNPTKEELKKWIELSKQPIKKFFNTSGILYREMNLKEKVAENNENELLDILSTNGMLVKRPLLVGKDVVLIGFKEKEWEVLKK